MSQNRVFVRVKPYLRGEARRGKGQRLARTRVSLALRTHIRFVWMFSTNPPSIYPPSTTASASCTFLFFHQFLTSLFSRSASYVVKFTKVAFLPACNSAASGDALDTSICRLWLTR